MTDEATMPAAAVAALVPYLVEASREGAKKLGAEAAGGAVQLLGWLGRRLTPGGRDALAKLEAAPGDTDRQAALRVALKDLLADDQGLRDELAHLIATMPQAAIDQRLDQQGDHNRAGQIAGDRNNMNIR